MVEDVDFAMGCSPVGGKRGRIEMAYFVLDRDETIRAVKEYLGGEGRASSSPSPTRRRGGGWAVSGGGPGYPSTPTHSSIRPAPR